MPGHLINGGIIIVRYVGGPSVRLSVRTAADCAPFRWEPYRRAQYPYQQFVAFCADDLSRTPIDLYILYRRCKLYEDNLHSAYNRKRGLTENTGLEVNGPGKKSGREVENARLSSDTAT